LAHRLRRDHEVAVEALGASFRTSAASLRAARSRGTRRSVRRRRKAEAGALGLYVREAPLAER